MRWLVALLLVGAVLRIHHLGTESAWLDEAFSIEISGTSLAHIVSETAGDVHPPLYYFALHYWRHLAGDSEAGARLFSVVASLGIVWAAYRLAVRLFEADTALVTAAVLVLSPFQVEFAQEARMYALLALFATLSTSAFLEFLRRPRSVWLVVYIVFAAAMTYTHIYSVFVIAGHGVTLVWLLVRDRRRYLEVAGMWLCADAIVLGLFSPWISILLAQTSEVEGAFWIAKKPWSAIGQPLATYAGSTELLFLIAPLALIGVWSLWRAPATPDDPPARTVVLPWLVCSIALPFLLSKVGSPIFLPKYTIAASVPFAMLTARGLVALPRRGWRLVAAVVGVGLTIPAFSTFYSTPRRDGWRGAVQSIEAEAKPGDLILFHQAFNCWPLDYYRRRGDLDERPFPLVGAAPAPDRLAAMAQHEAGARDRVWFVTTWSDPTANAIVDAFGRSFREVESRQWNGVETYLFERAD